MQSLVLGLLALLLGLIVTQRYVRANPHGVAVHLRRVIGMAALASAGVLIVRGATSLALPLAMLGAWLLIDGRWSGGTGSGSPAAATSSVTTDTLEMELDHASGEMRGRVRKGVFAGRRIEGMAPAELALLWRDCQFADPPSAQLIEAYLDRRHPSWKEDMARAESEPGPGGVMTVAEALDILGLKPGAGADDIRRAHRELMLKLHPDRGGSTYLATKINEAKELLLRKG